MKKKEVIFSKNFSSKKSPSRKVVPQIRKPRKRVDGRDYTTRKPPPRPPIDEEVEAYQEVVKDTIKEQQEKIKK